MNGKELHDPGFAENRRAHDLIADKYDLNHTEIYIDHDADPAAWQPDTNPYLTAYRAHCRLGLAEHLFLLIRIGELFTSDFWKCACITLFFNPRFERSVLRHADGHRAQAGLTRKIRACTFSRPFSKQCL